MFVVVRRASVSAACETILSKRVAGGSVDDVEGCSKALPDACTRMHPRPEVRFKMSSCLFLALVHLQCTVKTFHVTIANIPKVPSSSGMIRL